MSKTKNEGVLKAKQQLETKTFEAYPEWRRQLMISADENAPAVAPVGQDDDDEDPPPLISGSDSDSDEDDDMIDHYFNSDTFAPTPPSTRKSMRGPRASF